jgi:hypothetical protein
LQLIVKHFFFYLEFNEIENEGIKQNNSPSVEIKEKEDFVKEDISKEIQNKTNNSDLDLKFLFKNTRFFLIKSINHENVNIAKAKVSFVPFIF